MKSAQSPIIDILQTSLLACSLPVSLLLASATLATEVGPDNFEPPVNPYLADSPWPMSHRNSYNQASSPLPGPEPGEALEVAFLAQEFPSITLAYGKSYSNGQRAVYGSTATTMYKLDLNEPGIENVHQLRKSDVTANGETGAYVVTDIDNDLYVPKGRTLAKYRDKATSGKPPQQQVLEKTAEFTLPENILKSPDEYIIGINLSYDGYLVLATNLGLIALLSRDFASLYSYRLGEEETISNSLAVDEEGGIYVVTSKYMHRLAFDGNSITSIWRADYQHGPETPWPGRLGTGSGSTPTLMGTGKDKDKFVVFTDGQELTHLVLMWRDKIPADWTPVAPGKHIRIAAEIPVTFGNSKASRSISEQSVLVHGYGAMVVNNDYTLNTQKWPLLGNFWTILLSGQSYNQPFGVEKFQWDNTEKSMKSVWSNDISCPNGIPTMSAASKLAYCIGSRDNTWTLEAMDWNSGAAVFHQALGQGVRFNSTYAAAQVGEDNDIVTSTFMGVLRVQEKSR
ncbi:hypothetical protein [Thalassomonas haliotis]|uniref:Uncharacterized protein n=1 Tax=Thalassomonas haliotis TaxID=485448 RepID=A0ABY7VHC7_9GAMM|nr:hypothetical protein [Thalassomonas haliotis]WDE13130.1 hypothetical protein H3N35_06710 [Thalassomonas haliotis]